MGAIADDATLADAQQAVSRRLTITLAVVYVLVAGVGGYAVLLPELGEQDAAKTAAGKKK